MIVSFLLVFFRVTIGIVFMVSFLGKTRDISGFARTIGNFAILPKRLSNVIAVLFLSSELVTVVLVFWGGRLLIAAFALAALLLLVFTIALASVLSRNIQTPCHCFGASEQPVTVCDLWRNVGFILCAVGGWGISYFGDIRSLTWVEWSVIVVPALVFFVLMTQLSEITALFRPVWEK